MTASRTPWRFSLIALILKLGTAGELEADIITLFPVKDTTLSETTPDFNLGGLPKLISGTTAVGMTSRALLKFDIAGNVPSYANIRRVELSLTVVSQATDQSIYSLHRLLRNWGEGMGDGSNSGDPAKNGEATWQARFFPDILWLVPGATAPADFVEVPSGTQLIYQGVPAFTSSGGSPGIIADVQYWLNNPSSNLGWILICDDEETTGTVRSFGSREDASNAPALLIEFDFAPPSIFLMAAADTSLFEYTPDNNLGAATLVSGTIGLTGLVKRSRALIRFATEEIPTNVALTSATLKLSISKGPGGGFGPGNFSLFRVLHGDTRYVPTLVLEYVSPPKLDQIEVVGQQFNLYFVAQAGQAYFAQSRDSLSTGNWLTFTNIPAQTVTRRILISDLVTGSQRYYRVGL